MPSHKEEKLLNYPAETLFNLVADVEKYPEFLPWCNKCKIIKKFSETHFYAELEVSFRAFKKSYISEVKLIQNPDNYEISVEMIRGPFKKLINHWKFISKGEQTSLTFFIDLELKSSLLNKSLSLIFNEAYKKMVNAFEMRAKQFVQ